MCSLTIHGLALNLGTNMSGGTRQSQRVHYLEPWPQVLEKPDTSHHARNGMRHGPFTCVIGVSEANNRRGHPIPVVGGLASHPQIRTFAPLRGAVRLGSRNGDPSNFEVGS